MRHTNNHFCYIISFSFLFLVLGFKSYLQFITTSLCCPLIIKLKTNLDKIEKLLSDNINRIKEGKARNVKVKFNPRPPQNNYRTKYKLEIIEGRMRTRYLQISGRFEISLPERIFLCLI